MGSSCSSGQCKDKDSKKSSKKGKHGKDKSPRGSNASNSSIHPYQKATGDGAGQTKPEEGQLQVPPPVAAVTSQETSDTAQHAPAARLDSQPLSPISPTLLEQSPNDSGLPDFLSFPENVRPVIVGNINESATISRSNKIVLFVCADGEDSVAEREILHKNLHLLLRQKCIERGFEFLLFDLQQGLSRSHLLDHHLRTKSIQELKNISKNNYCIPLIILNETLGPVLPPMQIPKNDWDDLISSLTEQSEMDILNQWYILDENVEPASYTLQPVFSIYPNVQSNELKDRQEGESLWMKDEEQLTQIFKNFSNGKAENYLTTYLEDIVKEVIGNEHNLLKQCIWIARSFSDKPDAETEDNAIEILREKLQTQVEDSRILRYSVPWLNNQISPADNPQHSEYIDELTKELQEIILARLNLMMDQVDSESLKEYLGINKHLFEELIQQTKFCKRHLEIFTSQEPTLGKIEEYIRESKTSPLILHGPAASGKTAIMAKVVEQCSEWKEGAPVVFRFVGLTPRSATMEQLVCSICEQCCILYGEHPSLAYQNMSELGTQLPVLLEKVSPYRPLIVILDGLDQIADYGSKTLEWVLKTLPDQVKVILSIRDESEQLNKLKELIPDEECYVPLTNLDSEAILKIINNILSRSKRTITDTQKDKIKSAVGDKATPLSAVLLANKASTWSSSVEDFDLTTESEKLIENTLEHLEKAFGGNNVRRILAYLIAAKHGVTDSEILDLVSCDNELKSEALFPLSLWILMKNNLSSFLSVINIDKVCVTNCLGGSIKEIVQARYVPESICNEVSQLFIKYYQDNFSDDEKSTYAIPTQATQWGNIYNKRKLEELPFHVYRTGGDLIQEFLFNNDWLFAKLCGSNVYSVIEDIYLIKESTSDLLLLKELLQLSSYALMCDGLQIYSQIVARLPPLDEASYPLMAKLQQFASTAPVSSLLPNEPCLLSPSCVKNNTEMAENEEETIYFNSLHIFKNNATHMISLSAEHNEVIVWNIYDQTAVRKLKGVLLPRNIKMVDDFRAVILSNRELKVYNLDSGSFEVKIQGVMNQKMPFYGLHDENHVVALSRNRMYVNMANMETNQCVASFKVGEDRFLNSLLVSANGKICVCGDETQKPFPLLVWDLNSRKLLYDLRIPHHEFITNLSAITSDGHYVVSVCREVEYTSPNFIVVYDLQNGTMFKKWKPDVNVCSIAISAEGGCVVSGIENTNILVWDLTTGACRFSLVGHYSPVDIIQLDDSGLIAMSCHSSGRDRSIRVWNTKNGESLAVFTPDKPVVCCELSSDGKAVVLGISGCQQVITLLLCNQCSVSDNIPEVPLFGNAENAGKEVDLTGSG